MPKDEKKSPIDEKYTHVRIPREVKTRLDALTHDKESSGSVISRMIDFYIRMDGVNADVNAPVNTILLPVNSDVIDKLTELDNRVKALEQGTNLKEIFPDGNAPGTLEEIPVNNDVNILLTEPDEIPELPAGPATEPRTIAPDQAQLIPHEEEKVVPVTTRSGGKRTGAIPVTAEMREELIRQFDELNKAGMNDSHIARSAGVGKTMISLVREAPIFSYLILYPDNFS